MIKNAPQGSHCGGYEICRKSDPPQAENLASEILFYGQNSNGMTGKSP